MNSAEMIARKFPRGWSANFHPALRMALATAMMGCGDATTSTPSPRTLTVTLSKPVITRITDSATVSVMSGDVPAGNVSIAIASETRDFADIPVLSASALYRKVLLPVGTGTATLQVGAPGAAPTTVTVQVAPDRPTIVVATKTAHGVGSDTAILRGLKLDEVAEGALLIDGQPTPFLSRTATSARVVVPPVSANGCHGAAPVASLQVTNGDVASSVVLRRQREGELRIAVGDWQLLATNDVACLRLPAAKGAYIVAHVDMRHLNAARAGWPGIQLPDDYSVVAENRVYASQLIADVRHGAAGIASHQNPLQAGHFTESAATPTTAQQCSDEEFTSPFFMFWCRSRPWQVGDTFRIRRPGTGDTVGVTVYRIVGSHFVFAAIDNDNSARLQHLRATIDDVMPAIEQHAIPVLTAAFGNTYPRSSVGSGQLLTIIGDFTHGSVAGGCCNGGDVSSTVLLGSTLDGPPLAIFYLLAHEFTHAWQRRWYFDSRAADADPVHTGPMWGSEGGADLLALEAVRRYTGQPWRANISIPTPRDFALATLYMEAAASGVVQNGYVHASSFLRDIVVRLVQGGSTREQAFAEVARGAFEDWFGFVGDGSARLGLAARVSQLSGRNWEPGSALLLYALAQGADELTNNPDLQNPFYGSLWNDPTGAGFGTSVLVADHTPKSLSLQRKGGSVGHFRLEDGGNGSTVRLSSDRPATIWAIARVR